MKEKSVEDIGTEHEEGTKWQTCEGKSVGRRNHWMIRRQEHVPQIKQ